MTAKTRIPGIFTVLTLLSAAALANGRFPASTSVAFQPGDGRRIIVGTTFGVLFSTDDGHTWEWECESGIGYGGAYDPALAATAAGTLLAGVDTGLSISRDGGCSWSLAGDPLTRLWISDVAVASDGAVWVASTADGAANDVFVSRDDARSFTATHVPASFGHFLRVLVAPSDPTRVYVYGYRLDPTSNDGAQYVNLRSDDAGGHWTELGASSQQQLFLGVSPTDADVVFAEQVVPSVALLRSSDGGATWKTVLAPAIELQSFAALPDGVHVLVGGVAQHPDVYLSSDGGASFAPASQSPQMACAGVRPDGTLFACGANFMPDDFALGRSLSGDTWTPTLRFMDIAGPVACPAGTKQHDVCAPLWAGIAQQFALADAGTPADAAPTATTTHGGKCGCGVSLSLLAVVLWRPRARPARRARGRH